MPVSPSSKPTKVNTVRFFLLKKKRSMATTLKGYNAPINELNPVGINFKLQVLKPLDKHQ